MSPNNNFLFKNVTKVRTKQILKNYNDTCIYERDTGFKTVS